MARVVRLDRFAVTFQPQCPRLRHSNPARELSSVPWNMAHQAGNTIQKNRTRPRGGCAGDTTKLAAAVSILSLRAPQRFAIMPAGRPNRLHKTFTTPPYLRVLPAVISILSRGQTPSKN